MARISTGSGTVKFSGSSRNLEVSIESLEERLITQSVEEFLIKNEDGIIGIIVNSVKRAMTIGSTLSGKFGTENITINHSRFLTADRLMKDSLVLDIAGKESERNNFHIVIGTQVLEQSLDIDFDVLYSDIAPIASLIQRMGRLHRHERPERSISPRFVIIKEELNKSDDKSEPTARLIYGDWLVTVAELFFENKRNVYLPSQIEEMVEWNPDNFADNQVYREFTENNKNSRIQKTRDFTLKRPPSPRLTRLEKMKQQSLHGYFTVIQEDSKYGNLMESKVRDIDRPSVEVIAIFEGENGGLFLPIYENGEREEQYLTTEGEIEWSEVKSILSSTIKLPFQCSNLRFIKKLEKEAIEKYEHLLLHWKENKSLKGELFMVFSNQGNLIIDDIQLNYDAETGLEMINV